MNFYAFQLLVALDYCHKAGVIHRDIKPGNILVAAGSRELRLIDWGLAVIHNPGAMYGNVGTPNYKAPEMLTDVSRVAYDEKVDLWSFIVMVVAQVCGFRRVFNAKSRNRKPQLVEVVRFLGTDALKPFLRSLGSRHPISYFEEKG